MTECELICKIPEGLHARTAVELFCLIRPYGGSFHISAGGKSMDLNSVIDIMKMNIRYGDRLRLAVCCEREEEAVHRIEEYIGGEG